MRIVLFSNELQFHGLLLTVEKMLKSWMIWRRCGGDCGRDWDWGHNEIQYLECLGWLFGFNFMFPYLFSMYMLNRDQVCKGKITNWIKSLIQFPYSHRLQYVLTIFIVSFPRITLASIVMSPIFFNHYHILYSFIHYNPFFIPWTILHYVPKCKSRFYQHFNTLQAISSLGCT